MSKHKQTTRTPRSRETWFSGFSPLSRDLLAIGLIYVVTLLVFREIVLNGMAFSSQGDTIAALSYQRTGMETQNREGNDVIWMPGFFSGMPTFGNLSFLPHDVSYIQVWGLRLVNLLFLSGPWTWFVVFYFLGGVFTFFLSRQFAFSRPVALFAAFTFMLNPYAVGLAGEGHGSKLMALTYIPLLLMLTDLMFKRRDSLSFGLLAASIGTFFLTNHLQIVYYGFALIGFYLLFKFIAEYRSTPKPFVAGTAIFAAALIVGGCIASYIYLSVYEYAPFSVRGGGTAGSSGGLAWEYATNWSWHPAELITLLIPGFFGLKAGTYWGAMTPWQNSSVYVGLLPMIFAGFALLYRRTPLTIFLALVTLLAILVSFGRNFAVLFDLLFSVLPFFNKFRAPVMVLHLLPLLLGLLGSIGFAWVLSGEKLHEQQRRKLARILLISAGILGCVALLTLLLKSWLVGNLPAGMFSRDGEYAQLQQQYGQRASQAATQLSQMRFEIFWKDVLKFGLLGAAALLSIWAFIRGKLRTAAFVTVVVSLTVADLWFVSREYISPEPAANVDAEFRPDATTAFLKQQPGNFRIFPVGQLFMDNTFAYHGLQSIGGYSPAKLKIYQTLLDSSLERPLAGNFPWNMNLLNMLNTEYLVVPGLLPENPDVTQVYVDQARRLVTYHNLHALPRAWFVREAIVAENDAEVFSHLNSSAFDPARTAILHQPLPAPIFPPDSTARIEMTSYASRKIVLSTVTSAPALLVLSEVYYPAGWTARIDGVETEILRTNFALRSIIVPGGKHEIVFEFAPSVYRDGWIVTHAGWGIALLAILGGLWPIARRQFRRFAKAPAS